jgi:hypothetical protein
MKVALLLSILFFSIQASATNYYVSASGNDNNSGTSPSSPWQTLNRLNSAFSSFRPGDNIYLNRGDVFYGSIKVTQSGSSGSPITVSAYGSGNKPVVTGFTSVNSWNNLGGNIWESKNAVSSLPYTNMVAVNGVNTAMGRYPNSTGPNTGYLTIKSHSGNSSITGDGLGSNNWTGAGIVIRKARWALERGTIDSRSGNTLNYTDPGVDNPEDGFGFFIQNDPKTLDVNGEWYYNPSNHKLRVYSTSTPGDVKIATIENLVSIDRQSYIIFNNLAFNGSNSDALYCANYGSDLTVQNCDISFAGLTGIWAIMRNTLIQGNNISNANYLGIYTTEANINIQSNNLSNINMFEGMDQELASAGAIATVGANTNIQYNQINNCGYSGIRFGGPNSKITNNFINRFCLIKEDGGGIDMSSRDMAKGSIIDANIVLNGIGAKYGTSDETLSDFGGIFIDAFGTGITITNNTVANTVAAGIKLHGANNIIVKNNTTYNNGSDSWTKGGLELMSDPAFPIRNITIQGNILVAKTNQQFSFFYHPEVDNQNVVRSFGTASNNYYVKPVDESTAILINHTNYNVSGWMSVSGKDGGSQGSPKSITDPKDLRFEYNAGSSAKTIQLDGNYIDVKNVSYDGVITLAPYTSAVLIRNGAATQNSLLPAVNPANAVNGLDYSYYEGTGFNVVPDFSQLSSSKTGSVTNFDISVASRSEIFALNFSGYIDVPSDDQYTFYTSSDDGSMLYIDNQLVVNNDGEHAAQEKSGTIGLKAGKHYISVGYTQQIQGASLRVSYSSSSISKRVLPASALYRVATSNLLPASNPSNTVNGIDYKYYEGSDFRVVPTFSSLTPVKSGSITNFDIGVANRAELFAINFTGYINVPADGQYTFYTSSDDGSILYIDNQQVVNNDGEHGIQEASGSIGLKAGMHSISVGYAQQKIDAVLSVSYAGPGISKQIIPATAIYRIATNDLLPAVNPANTVNGIDYSYYEGSSFPVVPDFSTLTPVKTGTVTNFDIYIANRSERFAVNFSGYINVPADGQYTFYTASDDGSMLYIDNQLVVDNNGEHSVAERSGVIGLMAGMHAISVGYAQQKLDAVLNVSYSGSGVSKQIIPSTVMYRVQGSARRSNNTLVSSSNSTNNSSTAVSSANNLATPQLKIGILAYPNPFTNSILVSITGDAGSYDLFLTDALGRILIAKKGTKSIGTFQQNLNVSTIERGVYFLKVIQNNKASVIKMVK